MSVPAIQGSRVALIIYVKPECREEYLAVHGNPDPQVMEPVFHYE